MTANRYQSLEIMFHYDVNASEPVDALSVDCLDMCECMDGVQAFRKKLQYYCLTHVDFKTLFYRLSARHH